jgi:hypothetical protein
MASTRILGNFRIRSRASVSLAGPLTLGPTASGLNSGIVPVMVLLSQVPIGTSHNIISWDAGAPHAPRIAGDPRAPGFEARFPLSSRAGTPLKGFPLSVSGLLCWDRETASEG